MSYLEAASSIRQTTDDRLVRVSPVAGLVFVDVDGRLFEQTGSLLQPIERDQLDEAISRTTQPPPANPFGDKPKSRGGRKDRKDEHMSDDEGAEDDDRPVDTGPPA